MTKSVFLLVLLLCPFHVLAQQSSTQISPASSTVVVLGTFDPATQGQSSRSVVALDTNHPPLLQDVEDYLRTDSSVDIEQRGTAGVQADISIRGGSFEQTLVLVNGLRINDAETSHFDLDLPVPLEALSAIDVLHGAGSTLYGSDALAGVVDFLSAKPETDVLHLRSGLGSFGENQQGFVGSLANRKWSQTVAGSRDFSTGFIADRDYRTADGSSESWLTSPLGETDILLAGSDRPFGAARFYGEYPSWERTKGWFASLDQHFDPETETALAYRRHSDIFVLLRDDPDFYKNQHIDESWQGALRRKQPLFHAATLYFGLEENTDQIQSNNLGRHGRNRDAGYLDLDLARSHLPLPFTLTIGLREELLSGGQHVLSPDLAGSLSLRPSLKLRSSAGYGFRLPTYTDLYYSDPTTIGDPNLKPESAWNFDGGLDWYPSGRTTASATVFYSRQNDTIDYVRAAPTDPWQASNLDRVRFTGIETSLTLHPTATQEIRLGWSALSGAQNALHGLQSEYIFNYPVNNSSFEWTDTLKRQLVVRTRVTVTERYHQAPYPVWDLSLSRLAGRLHPYLQLTNLSNTGYQEIPGIPMPPRALLGGVEIVLRKETQRADFR
jgi:iron complex outermembrane receptor protein